MGWMDKVKAAAAGGGAKEKVPEPTQIAIPSRDSRVVAYEQSTNSSSALDDGVGNAAGFMSAGGPRNNVDRDYSSDEEERRASAAAPPPDMDEEEQERVQHLRRLSEVPDYIESELVDSDDEAPAPRDMDAIDSLRSAPPPSTAKSSGVRSPRGSKKDKPAAGEKGDKPRRPSSKMGKRTTTTNTSKENKGGDTNPSLPKKQLDKAGPSSSSVRSSPAASGGHHKSSSVGSAGSHEEPGGGRFKVTAMDGGDPATRERAQTAHSTSAKDALAREQNRKSFATKPGASDILEKYKAKKADGGGGGDATKRNRSLSEKTGGLIGKIGKKIGDAKDRVVDSVEAHKEARARKRGDGGADEGELSVGAPTGVVRGGVDLATLSNTAGKDVQPGGAPSGPAPGPPPAGDTPPKRRNSKSSQGRPGDKKKRSNSAGKKLRGDGGSKAEKYPVPT